MKEQILNTFAAMGFQLEEMEGFGYGFRYEGINYLYMPNDDDEDFLNIAVPAIVEINDENIHAVHLLMDKLNSTLKYVKANKLGDSMWLFYERELYGGEDFEKLLSRMILHLEAARTSTAMLWRISRRNLTTRMMTSPLVTMRKQRKQQ